MAKKKISEIVKGVSKEDVPYILSRIFLVCIFVSVAAGLLYLSIKQEPLCFVSLGLWILSFVVMFIPMPDGGGVCLNVIVMVILMGLAACFAYRCFGDVLRGWVLDICARLGV